MFYVHCSDTMGNQGAFINIKGNDLTPKFTSYKAVVSLFDLINVSETLSDLTFFRCFFVSAQPHPNVKPMAFANSLMNQMM